MQDSTIPFGWFFTTILSTNKKKADRQRNLLHFDGIYILESEAESFPTGVVTSDRCCAEKSEHKWSVFTRKLQIWIYIWDKLSGKEIPVVIQSRRTMVWHFIVCRLAFLSLRWWWVKIFNRKDAILSPHPPRIHHFTAAIRLDEKRSVLLLYYISVLFNMVNICFITHWKGWELLIVLSFSFKMF